MSSRTSAQSLYIPGFDGIRAIAVAMVLVAHAGYGQLIPGGFGVTIFFSISGYLITTLLLNEIDNTGRINLKLFYARRVIRLYPELMALFVLCMITGPFLGMKATISEWFAGPFYYMNYYYVFGAHYLEAESYPWRQLWSLAIEEHFYIFFPGALLLLSRSREARLRLIYALILIPFLWRFVAYFELGLPWQYNYVATEARIDSIAWGCLLAVLLHGRSGQGGEQRSEEPLWFVGRWMVPIGLCLILGSLLYRSEAFRWTWRFSIQGIGVMFLIANLLFDKRWRKVVSFLELKPIRYCGRISYGLYLYHMLINRILVELFPSMPRAIFLTASLIISFLVASSSYALLEKPLKTVRRRLGSHVR